MGDLFSDFTEMFELDDSVGRMSDAEEKRIVAAAQAFLKATCQTFQGRRLGVLEARVEYQTLTVSTGSVVVASMPLEVWKQILDRSSKEPQAPVKASKGKKR
jgi:hypothetical protein